MRYGCLIDGKRCPKSGKIVFFLFWGQQFFLVTASYSKILFLCDVAILRWSHLELFAEKGVEVAAAAKVRIFFSKNYFKCYIFFSFFVSKSHLCAMRTKSCAFHSPHAYHHRTGCGTGILSLAHHRTDVRHHRIYI